MDQPEDIAPPKAKRGCPASPLGLCLIPSQKISLKPRNASKGMNSRRGSGPSSWELWGQEANIDHELDAPGDMANTGVSNNPDEAMDDATRSILAGPSGGAPLRDQGGVLRKLTACKGSSAPREKKRRARNTPDIFFRCQAPNELRNFTKVLGIPQAERMLEHLHVILGIFPDGVPSQCPPGIAFTRAGIWVNEWVTEVQNFIFTLILVAASKTPFSDLDESLQAYSDSTSFKALLARMKSMPKQSTQFERGVVAASGLQAYEALPWSYQPPHYFPKWGGSTDCSDCLGSKKRRDDPAEIDEIQLAEEISRDFLAGWAAAGETTVPWPKQRKRKAAPPPTVDLGNI
ncbi:hypothetical protein H4Q26_010634 [Puccinia striiformis f. sp. tritici PST-130]|nr:hypothetical protein H4Q26_010634 [Puccinia striiformis f. sp. tritici PST-130]